MTYSPLELRYLAQHLDGVFIICGRREGRREGRVRKGRREEEGEGEREGG